MLAVPQLSELRKQERVLSGADRKRVPEKVVFINVFVAVPCTLDLMLTYLVSGSASWKPSYGQ